MAELTRGDEIQGAKERLALASTLDSSAVSFLIDSGWPLKGQISPWSLSSCSWASRRTPSNSSWCSYSSRACTWSQNWGTCSISWPLPSMSSFHVLLPGQPGLCGHLLHLHHHLQDAGQSHVRTQRDSLCWLPDPDVLLHVVRRHRQLPADRHGLRPPCGHLSPSALCHVCDTTAL